VNFTSDPAQNALVFSVTDLAGGFKSKSFRIKESIFIATGSADVSMKNVGVTVGIQMTTQPGSEGRKLPAIAAVDVSVSIDKKGIDIKLSGNIWTTFANWFEWFFESTICSQIEAQLKDQITNTLPKIVNQLILASDGYATPAPFEKITEFLTVDFSQINPVAVTAVTIVAGINGFAFDNRYPKVPVPG
jgi:hypothetical protein